jgi:hypothetical protein
MASIFFLLASCSSFPQLSQLKPISEGEARLTGIEMPEYVHENLPYDIILRIESEGTPKITKACFRWLTEALSSNSPSLSCYANNDTYGPGSQCVTMTSEVNPSSSSFCVDASNIRTDVPGRLYVKVRSVGLKASYNTIEGTVEYVCPNGQVRMSNPVKTPVIVEE